MKKINGAKVFVLSLLWCAVACGGSASNTGGNVTDAGNVTEASSDAANSGANACPAPTPPAPIAGGFPNAIGCYAGTAQGWIKEPCLGDFTLLNPVAEPVTVELQLNLELDAGTVLGPRSSVSLSVTDPDGTFANIWQAQPENGTAFTLSSATGETDIRVLANSLTLAPVPLAACGTFFENSSVVGDFSELLTTHAVVKDAEGAVITTQDASTQGLEPL